MAVSILYLRDDDVDCKTIEIMDKSALSRAITRITYEIIEKNRGLDGVCIIGIYTKGINIADRIAQRILEIENTDVPVGYLDITPFRDDERRSTAGDRSNIPFDITGRKVVLVDDVIYTGRTIRAAIDAIMSRGRPKRIELAVIVDRGHRELPIRPDYIGKNLPTSREETVKVRLSETDGTDGVAIIRKI